MSWDDKSNWFIGVSTSVRTGYLEYNQHLLYLTAKYRGEFEMCFANHNLYLGVI